jgi:enoyl-CoA hydratase/carnithine racemase
MSFALLDYTVRERVAEITMRRTPVNAIDHALIDELNAAYRMARDDSGVRAVILTSAFDRAFSAGMDLAMIRGGSGLDLLDEARRLAAEFAAKSPVVMKLARDSFLRQNDFEYRRAIENTVETICNIIATEDAQEGLDAFNEKRPPRW